ncbi:uncharacterized protein LOC118188533 isoform X2 [Stegodyphus dumicola]|uniref:uncharacterized protein LOC118188533 isoform X2 n=1 Tax=Stegodyphus dumicola TaxID=202533 RepID=UPI0015AC1CBA|nr:uncharacterized protein LOC118188533 isoform X2 [Stegodyphus dumicola]
MPLQKKWHEYSRPIPCGDYHRRITQERYFKENRARRQWERTYGPIIDLYRHDKLSIPEQPSSYSADMRCREVISPDCRKQESEILTRIIPSNPDIKETFLQTEGHISSVPRFRELKFPPKCNHVCARMGFECWMCDSK